MRIVALTALLLLVVGLAGFACIVELMPYDARMYLTAAWSYLDPNRPFAIVAPNFRQPFYPLLLAPCLLNVEAQPFGFLATRLPHLIAAAFTGGYLATAWLIVRRCGASRELLVAALFLVLNPVLIHYGAMPMHDLPAGLLVQLALLAWLRWRATGSALAAAGLVVALACLIAMRLNLGIVVPALWLATAVAEYRDNPSGWHRRLLRPTLAATAAIAGGLILMMALYAWADHSLAAGPRRVVNLVRALTSIPPYSTDPIWEYGWDLGFIMGPALLLAIVGCICGLRSRDDASLALALVTLVVLAAQTIVIGHKEVRYLLPIATGLAWFAARGFCVVAERLPSRWAAVLLGLILIVPGLQSVRAVKRLAAPIYHEPFVEPLAATIRDAQADGRAVYWNGNTHPIAPADYRFGPYDEYYAVWHFGVPDWYLATGGATRHVGNLPHDAFLDPRRANFLAGERALVVQGRLKPFYTTTLDQEATLPAVRLLWFEPADNPAGYRIQTETRQIPGW